MKRSKLTCRDADHRRRKIQQNPDVGGLEYVEVGVTVREAGEEKRDGRLLKVVLLGKAPASLDDHRQHEMPHTEYGIPLDPRLVRIRGGRRRSVRVERVWLDRQSEDGRDDVLTVRVDRTGDFSVYTCEIMEIVGAGRHARGTNRLHPDFDPLYAFLPFSFKQGCPSDIDGKQAPSCPEPARPAPEISYLAKDFDGFRQLILDRLSTVMPEWTERNEADVGIMLVEILAYVADQLSYYQDAVATEAYLATARRRISVRRHVRLVDYVLHEGCNARAFVHVGVEGTDALPPLEPGKFFFSTADRPGQPGGSQVLTEDEYDKLAGESTQRFDPLIEPPSAPWFTLDDLKNSGCLAQLLKVTHAGYDGEPGDPIAAKMVDIIAQRSSVALQLLLDYDYPGHGRAPERLEREMVAALNSLLTQKLPDSPALERRDYRSGYVGALSHDDDRALLWLNRQMLEELFAPQVAARQHRFDPDTGQIVRKSFVFRAALGEMHFHTWGNRQCCLPEGATSATLKKADDDEGPASQQAQQMPPAPASQQAQQSSPSNPVAGIVCDPVRAETHGLEDLQPGDFLVFEEVRGAKTGTPEDANAARRHAVRLTAVRFDVDRVEDCPVVHIEWAADDALPFQLCISAIGPPPECSLIENVSVARGNMLVVDHGAPSPPDDLGAVPPAKVPVECEAEGRPSLSPVQPEPFSPSLGAGPLVYAQPLEPQAAASQILEQSPSRALPALVVSSIIPAPGGAGPLFSWAELDDPNKLFARLNSKDDVLTRALNGRLSQRSLDVLLERADAKQPHSPLTPRHAKVLYDDGLLRRWTAQADLLGSGPDDRHFVVETEHDGTAQLRFGDGELGEMPQAGEAFRAAYRIGGGVQGNVGAEKTVWLILTDTVISGVDITIRNPFPARGGTQSQPVEEAGLLAPHEFRKQIQRAIIPDDYAEIAQRDFDLQQAAAARRWTGAWDEILVAVDPPDRTDPAPELLRDIEHHLQRFRRIGHEVVVRPPEYVPLEITLAVHAIPDYLRGDVKRELLAVLGNRPLADGRRGLFHPDALTFGQSVQMSEVVAAAQAVRGVERVEVATFQRYQQPHTSGLDEGVIPLDPVEVARLDNDPDFPENGVLNLQMEGGR